jgi:single-strand DNA-binding protein
MVGRSWGCAFFQIRTYISSLVSTLLLLTRAAGLEIILISRKGFDMANGLNRVFLIGNIGKEPNLREVGENAVLEFTLATSESFQGRDGNRRERTEWHTIKVWGKRAQALGKFLTKGMMLCVEGSIRTESWERDGEKKYKTTIVANNIEILRSPGRQSELAQNRQGGNDDEMPF